MLHPAFLLACLSSVIPHKFSLPSPSTYEITGPSCSLCCASGQHSANLLPQLVSSINKGFQSGKRGQQNKTHLFNTEVQALLHCGMPDTRRPLSSQLWSLILTATLCLLSWIHLTLLPAPLTTITLTI